MRIDSCRSCGGTLQELQSCPDCKECIQFTCPSCKKFGEIHIHPECSMAGNAIAN